MFDASYTELGRIGDPCVYCGQPSDTYDHVPPLHYVERMSQTDVAYANLRKYPACRECNSSLSGNLLETLKERRQYTKAKLRKRYRSYLNMPNWDEEELADMGDTLADEIRRANDYAHFVRQRLAWRN